MSPQESFSSSSQTTKTGQHECCTTPPASSAIPGKSFLGRVLLTLGISGAVLAALCCAAPFLLAGALAAMGLSFILKDSILMPLLALFIVIAVLGFILARRKKDHAPRQIR